MALDDSTLHSRRALIAGTLGALAAAAAQAIGRPLPTRAANDSVTWSNNENGANVVSAYSIRYTINPTSGTGTAVYGSSYSGHGVHGNSSRGVGIYGVSGSDSEPSLYGLKTSHGNAVLGDIQDSSNGAGAVFGKTSGSGPGVYGVSTLGRGGRFNGKQAQIRLDPSRAAHHPASGAAGDFFVDASNRLYFCRGGAIWIRLA